MSRRTPTPPPSPDDGLRSLDAAFELPDVVADPKLRSLYEVLVARMRDEAKNLPMNTVQQLLIERIAFNYIVLRSKERGELGGFNNTNVQKDYNSFWLSMTAEFNRLLGRTEALSGQERKTMFKVMHAIVADALTAVASPAERAAVMERMADAVERSGF